MAKKYYDYLKPKAPRASFSDVVSQQITLLEAQQRRQAATQLKSMKDGQKAMVAQEKQLLGFDTEGFSDVHKEAFNNKLLHTRGKVNSFYYTGANQGEFFEDIMALKELHGDFKRHSTNVSSEKTALEGWVTGTKDWTDKNNELKDDMTTLSFKNQMWNTSGVDIDSIEYDPATGDAFAFYTDINGKRLKGDDGNDLYGPISESPTLGSKSYYSPTSSPYGNLLPGAFSKEFSSSLSRLEGETLEEKTKLLRGWVTEEAKNNPNVVATASKTFKDNYGDNVYQSILKSDEATRGEEEGYIPMDLREYIDETMRFLTGTLQKDDSGDSEPIFPSSVQFNIADFPQIADVMVGPTGGGYNFGREEDYGKGITALMVPKSGVGKSGIMIESSYQPQDKLDPRSGESGSQYRVNGVAMDENRNLFVRAEMYVDEDVSKLSADRLAALANIQGVDIDAETKTATSKVIRNFVVRPIDHKGEQNQEYQSIITQIGVEGGADKGSHEDGMRKGMEVLRRFNDEQAQLMASESVMKAQNPEPNPNEQMMKDIQFMNIVLPELEKRYGDNANIEITPLLNYVKQFPEQRERILESVMDGKIPYIGSGGQLLYEQA